MPLKPQINIAVEVHESWNQLQEMAERMSNPDYLYMHKLITHSEWEKRCKIRDEQNKIKT